jgi:hypothetical protein
MRKMPNVKIMASLIDASVGMPGKHIPKTGLSGVNSAAWE